MSSKPDYTLEMLINLDGFIAEIGDGFWVKIEARRVMADEEKPHGVKYSLTLHDATGKRVVGYDNAHSIPFKASIKAHDHMHKSGKIISYPYTDTEALLGDFWQDVDRILGRRT